VRPALLYLNVHVLKVFYEQINYYYYLLTYLPNLTNDTACACSESPGCSYASSFTLKSVFISGFSNAFENWPMGRYPNTHFIDCSREDSKGMWNDFTFF